MKQKLKLNDESARTAAKWWADRLREGAKLDHGPRSLTDFVAVGLGRSIQEAAAKGRTEEQIQRFEDALYEELKVHELLPITYITGIDYHPVDIFLRAANKAGIKLSASCLPWKTHMYYINGVVKVRYGYGAPLEDVEVGQ